MLMEAIFTKAPVCKQSASPPRIEETTEIAKYYGSCVAFCLHSCILVCASTNERTPEVKVSFLLHVHILRRQIHYFTGPKYDQ